MTFSNPLMERLGLTIPIIQAPMLGATDRAIAIAVSEAGGLGSFAASGASPAAIGEELAAIRAATANPFAANLLMTTPDAPDGETVERAIARLAPWRRELGLGAQAVPNRWSEDFAGQLAALTAAAPPVASFAFSILSAEAVQALKANGVFVIGSANMVAEARAWEAVGADAVCAQGFEAGGHHTSFLGAQEDAHIGTLALVPAVKAAVSIPVIAAGGIMDGRGVAAALLLGADAVQMGTAFLLTDEAKTSAPWRQALREAGDDPTQLTRAFSGRYARGLENRFMREMRAMQSEIPAYPIQNALTKEMRKAATDAGNTDMLSLWAGQGVGAIREMPARELVLKVWQEAQDEIAALSARMRAP